MSTRTVIATLLTLAVLASVATAVHDIDCDDLERVRAFQPIFLSTGEEGAIILAVIPYGATAVGLEVPDHYGHMHDVLLGFENTTLYCSNPPERGGHPYFGATIGRVANRVRAPGCQ